MAFPIKKMFSSSYPLKDLKISICQSRQADGTEKIAELFGTVLIPVLNNGENNHIDTQNVFF